MSGKSKEPADHLFRLRDELAADAMNTSDDEILEETKIRGVDPIAAAERVAEVLKNAVFAVGKRKMEAARAAVRQQQETKRTVVIDVVRGRAILNKAAKKDPELYQRLTLAARKGEGQSDRDVETLIDDLLELGVLQEDDLK